MIATPSKPGDKPAGLIHVVVYTDAGEKKVAAFTDREMAEAFGAVRTSGRSDGDCTIVEAVLDARAASAPAGE